MDENSVRVIERGENFKGWSLLPSMKISDIPKSQFSKTQSSSTAQQSMAFHQRSLIRYSQRHHSIRDGANHVFPFYDKYYHYTLPTIILAVWTRWPAYWNLLSCILFIFFVVIVFIIVFVNTRRKKFSKVSNYSRIFTVSSWTAIWYCYLRV